MTEIEILERVAEVFASADNANRALAQFLGLARQVADSPFGAIYLRDETRGVFLRWSEGTDTPQYHLPLGLVDGMFAGKASIEVSLDHPALTDLIAAEAGRQAQLRSALGLPLRYRGVLVGILALAFREDQPVSTTNLRILSAIAGFPASAVEHARTQAATERRARLAQVLRQFGQRLLGVVEEKLLHRLILDTAVELTGSDQASIAEVSGDRITVVAGIGKDERFVGSRAPTSKLEEVLTSEEPYVVQDVDRAESESLLIDLARENAAGSFMAVGMRHQDQMVAYLFAGAKDSHRYCTEEVEAVQILASMAAAVLLQRRAQAAAESHARRLAATIEDLPIVIEILDSNGALRQANRAARLFRDRLALSPGSAADPFPGYAIETLDGASRLALTLPAAQALAGGDPMPSELVLIDATGRRRTTLLMAAVPLFDERSRKVESVVVACQDVSTLHALAEDKNRFLRIASHELRSPVTALRATIQLLQLDEQAVLDPARRETMLGRLDRQSLRLIGLVEQLLDSARLQTAQLPLQVQRLDLVELCRQAVVVASATRSGRPPPSSGPIPPSSATGTRFVWSR